MKKATTIGELRQSGYRVLPVKEEMRKNLIAKVRAREELFPGILGFDETAIPQLENAILSGQDMIILGERGQAKSRIIRSLVGLLDDEVPAIAGCEINDNPYNPICRACRDKVEDLGDEVEIAWLRCDERYSEKLATPDITIADLIGEVDPIRVAEGRYLSDELTIHYGLIPRTNRGIFAINELPDLAERIQVGLLNIMEERDVQIRGYRVRLPLDVYVVASANPEDYTNRGRIITPLKDRCGSQIRTHYPKTGTTEMEIVGNEWTRFEDEELKVSVPEFISDIIAVVTMLARRSPDINQRSGVSVRVSISNYENVVSNATRRAIRLDERRVVPRPTDLSAIHASMSGKIELETVEDGREEQVVDKLTQQGMLQVFNQYFSVQDFEPLLLKFDEGLTIDVSDTMPASVYVQRLQEIGGMSAALKKLGVGRDAETRASALEFILEGLHLSRKLNKDRSAGGLQYRG